MGVTVRGSIAGCTATRGAIQLDTRGPVTGSTSDVHDMSDIEAMDSEAEGGQQNGPPLFRKVDQEGRTGRGRSSPSDPMATRDDEDEDDMVEHGGRGSDAGFDDDERVPERHAPCLSPAQQTQQSSGAMTSRVRSTVSRPVQLQLTCGARGAGMLQLCRPKRSEGENLSTICQ